MRKIFWAASFAAAVLAAGPAASLEEPAAVSTSAARRAEDDAYKHVKVLVEVLNYIQEEYVDPPDARHLLEGAADGMVRTLDPYSQYLDPEENKEMKVETEGQFGGLGLRVSVEEQWLTVITPMPGTPAYQAGILPGDRIVGIEGTPTKDMNLSDAVKKLRGKPGTKTKLTILRGPPDGGEGQWNSMNFELMREIVKVESVEHWILEEGIGYVRILEFSANTADETRRAIEDLKGRGAAALILDLRNNPGGLLPAAVDTASLFLGDNRMIVYTQGRRPESREEFRANAPASFPEMPMIVLVNGGSASGAEIVAGALQDHHRAVLVGSRTFGKATVQSLIPLSDGAGLRLTIAHYFTPNGRMINRNPKKNTGGILPDIVIMVPKPVEAGLYRQWEMIYAKGRKPRSIIKDSELVKDEALDRAEELLKARDILGTLKPRG